MCTASLTDAFAGMHWMWEIVPMLVTGSTNLTTKRMETNGFLMVASPTELDSLPSSRVLTTHCLFHELPSDFIIKRRKIVCIICDPKDVCVSYYHMLKSVKRADYDGTFDGFLTLFLNGHGKSALASSASSSSLTFCGLYILV